MSGYTRYAIYAVPTGPLYDLGAAWLGWDTVAGRSCAQPDLPGLPLPPEGLTARPRKYGLHGTIKAPFRLAPGTTAEALETAAGALLARLAPVTMPGLAVRPLSGFVALVPDGPAPDLAALAAAVVAGLDGFRAPASQAETARRRSGGLSPRQDAMLTRWGYPFVLEEFRFHLTLTGRVPRDALADVTARLAGHFAPTLAKPWRLEDLALMGEDAEGRFHLIRRVPLAG